MITGELLVRTLICSPRSSSPSLAGAPPFSCCCCDSVGGVGRFFLAGGGESSMNTMGVVFAVGGRRLTERGERGMRAPNAAPRAVGVELPGFLLSVVVVVERVLLAVAVVEKERARGGLLALLLLLAVVAEMERESDGILGD